MRGAELYDRVINTPTLMDLVTAVGVAGLLIVVAAGLLSVGKYRLFARILGVLGVVLIMVVMFFIHEQTTREKSGKFITVTRFSYPESTRFQVRVALLGLPAAAALVMVSVLGSTRERLRSTVPDHLREGRKLLAQGGQDAAIAEFNQALQISPYLGEAFFQRGCAYQAKGEFDLALADFSQALQCDPQLVLAHLQRGRILTEKGDLEAALADYDQVMAMRPNDAECYLNRGVCLARRGLISEAIMDFQRVLKLTNHSDFAEPARYYLDQLGGADPLPPPGPLPGPNGTVDTPALTPEEASQDYVL